MAKFLIKDSDKVRYLIAKSGNNIKSFSELIGVSYSYMSRVVSGKNNPSVLLANKISNTLTVDVEELFHIEKEGV